MRFRIGHASKALTSGRLHLDDEIQKYVPAFPKKEWPVTLRQLMGHVAGVRQASHASRTLLGDSTSFMAFPERGIVVAVTSNTSKAATRSIALQIARRPSRNRGETETS